MKTLGTTQRKPARLDQEVTIQTRKRGVTVGCGGYRDSDDGGGGFGYFSRGGDGGVGLEMMTMVCRGDGSGGGAWRGGDGVRGCDGGVRRCGGRNPA
ncbi:hypothetical protein Tco_0206385 [Tanacetum coccineum]